VSFTSDSGAFWCASGIARASGPDTTHQRPPFHIEINEVFAILPQHVDVALKTVGARYYDWPVRCLAPAYALGPNARFVRLITSFSTPQGDVEKFIETA
jgi:threonine aldolase